MDQRAEKLSVAQDEKVGRQHLRVEVHSTIFAAIEDISQDQAHSAVLCET